MQKNYNDVFFDSCNITRYANFNKLKGFISITQKKIICIKYGKHIKIYIKISEKFWNGCWWKPVWPQICCHSNKHVRTLMRLFFEKPGECFPQKADNCLPLLTLIKKPHVPDHHPQSREVNPLWLQLLAAITQCLLDVTPSLQTASAAMLTLTLFYQSHFKPALDI